jgi:hypothetical protein
MPRALTITAILAAYNEEDVIGAVLADLMGQGVRVHLLDQGSTDGTVEEARRVQRDGLLEVEHLEGQDFSLARIIRRKEVLAAELKTDWIVNADADEIRESPWPGISFADGIEAVDRLGYNAIDFAVINFLPVHDGFRKGDDPREVFRFYEPGGAFDRLQVRCWKKEPGALDLVSTAGHEARFPGRKVFPLRFLLRHYPIRSQAHGERKVFRERRDRFAADERARGWHVQYDGLPEGASFLREPSSLIPYDPWDVRLQLALRHRGMEELEEKRRTTAEAQAAAERDRDVARAEGTALRHQLAAVRGELAGSRDAFTSARELAGVLAQQLDAGRSDLAARGRQVEAARAERDTWLRAHAAAQQESDERARDVAELRREAERTGERLAALQYRLDSVLASRAWRWTASLRALLDALSGR